MAAAATPCRAAPRPPPGPDRHPVRAPERHALGDAASGEGRRFRDDLRAVVAGRVPAGIARRGAAHGSGLGVARTLAWLRQFRRLRVRHARRADIHEAFLTLGCALVCARHLPGFC